MQHSMFIGLDVHKATISVAVADGERGGEVRSWGVIPHRVGDVQKIVERLSESGQQLHFCYEAGPCGYGLHRQLVDLGHECIVVAPSLIPVKSGDRVKTDRRDAMMLARLHRAGELTAVWVPDEAHEAIRDLVRARATAVRVVGKARQHLQGFLLRHSRVYGGQKRLDVGLSTLANDTSFPASRAADRLPGLCARSHRRGGSCRTARETDQGSRLQLEPRASC